MLVNRRVVSRGPASAGPLPYRRPFPMAPDTNMGVSKRGTATITAVLATAALLAGCGEDESDAKTDYLAQGDEICALGTFQIGQQAGQRYGQTAPPEGKTKEYVEEIVVPTLRREVLVKLRELPSPEGDEQTTAAVYDALEQGIDALDRDPELIADPGTGGAFDEANRLAQEYGFRQCGSST